MRGTLESSERVFFLKKNISLLSMGPANRGSSEWLGLFKGSEKLMGKKQQEKLNEVDTSWWIWLINNFVNKYTSIIWGSLDIFNKDMWKKSYQGLEVLF